MKTLTLATAFVLLVPCLAPAQSAPDHPFLPFVFAAPGAVSAYTPTLHFGGGFERVVWNGIGAGAEVGYLAPFEALGWGLVVASFNGVYDGFHMRSRVTPFVSGGYSLAFRYGIGTAINFGGGFNYWFRDGKALRIEFRDHLPIYDGGVENFHLWGVRVGITWKK